jgi:hypothetical protein
MKSPLNAAHGGVSVPLSGLIQRDLLVVAARRVVCESLKVIRGRQ